MRSRYAQAIALLGLASVIVASPACSMGAPSQSNNSTDSPAAEPYPAAEVLAAFRDACGDLASLSSAEARARGSGWELVANPSGTPIGPLIEFARSEGERLIRQAGGTGDPMLAFRKTVAGEDLFLVLSQVRTSQARVSGCRLFDVAEERRITIAEASAWLGREPGETVDQAELVRGLWNPGLTNDQDSFELFYIPAGSPVLEVARVPGIGLKADQIGPGEPNSQSSSMIPERPKE